ncbi:MAG: hypothetical protein VR64_22090 [Desulfatitalea sp. BRH_c12]|nr:MAG: hypothetical protein VR64_22090 [Desulfatitalea sp. BRH_c12]
MEQGWTYLITPVIGFIKRDLATVLAQVDFPQSIIEFGFRNESRSWASRDRRMWERGMLSAGGNSLAMTIVVRDSMDPIRKGPTFLLFMSFPPVKSKKCWRLSGGGNLLSEIRQVRCRCAVRWG